MAQPITWRTITAPDATASVAAMDNASDQLANAFKSFENVGKIYAEREADAKAKRTEDNTRSVYQSLQKIEDVDTWKTAVASGDFSYDTLKNNFGNELDFDAIDSIVVNKEKTLMDLEKSRNDWSDYRQGKADAPILANYRTQLSQMDLNDPAQLEQAKTMLAGLQVSDKAKADMAELFDTTRKGDVSEFRDTKRFNNQQTVFGQGQADRRNEQIVVEQLGQLDAHNSQVTNNRAGSTRELINQLPPILQDRAVFNPDGSLGMDSPSAISEREIRNWYKNSSETTKTAIKNLDPNKSYVDNTRDYLLATFRKIQEDQSIQFKNTPAMEFRDSSSVQLPKGATGSLANLVQGRKAGIDQDVADRATTGGNTAFTAQLTPELAKLSAARDQELERVNQKEAAALEQIPDLYAVKANQEDQNQFLKDLPTEMEEMQRTWNFNWGAAFGNTLSPKNLVSHIRKVINDAAKSNKYTIEDPTGSGEVINVPIPPSVIRKAMNNSMDGEVGDEDFIIKKFDAQIELGMKDYINNNRAVRERIKGQAEIERQNAQKGAEAALRRLTSSQYSR